MVIKEAKFVTSNTRADLCPQTQLPEYAFIGRSNVGKSSLINMLTNHLKLAKTSSFPGKTQLINHFLINGEWYLVDLPGYGWAKVSKDSREQWRKMVQFYLKNRTNLACVFVLVDSRLPPQKTDLEFIELLGTMGVPFVLIFTKTDKQSGTKTDANIAVFMKTLQETWEELPMYMKSSSTSKEGREEILNFIASVNQRYQEEQ
ncbi:ribosome biogenesis GTP-binding protein YihA/YsxC [Rufibacter glacialis]|uniref:Probable GTP-binding protein EngB n=1 Tax=Rufibacter glacialis TaxID=1259555 RepID=A0A5M8QL41_9BACT|nr:ribosome biogenesis GTP-binding protein YihA/YsxC [Rufibacter glacialis]KAA6435694.1 YihA family ribosome biogenesis GTP-binding protein [Rufibacter glacialis]GGK65704.1 putative GTP-binding protein EngB [Rufibacter glacialis]